MAKPPLRPRGRGGGSSTKTMLTWTFLLFLAAAVQAQSSHSSKSRRTIFASTETANLLPSQQPQPGSSPPEIPLLNHHITTVKFRSTDDDTTNHKFDALAPAPEIGAVRAPLAQSVQSPSGPSLNAARLLQNWEAENIVLLATIDGVLHARDRTTGSEKWSMGNLESPMIQTIHHCYNKTDNGEGQCDHEYIFIVEPSQDGNLYVQHKNPQIGLQRLGVTVKSLASDTPGFVEDPPLVTISETKTTAYVVDAASGVILSHFGSHSAFVNDNQERSCRRLSGFELDDPACDSIGTINIGRVEYTVQISNKMTRELLCTIKFAEWVPNKQDSDLQDQYVAPLDNSHIETYYNGRIRGMKNNHPYTRKLSTPVARVFDVVRPLDRSEIGELKLLSRPLNAPLLAPAQYSWNDVQRIERVFVNKTESGIWYALSELSYPGVTAGAKPANSDWNYDSMPLDLDNDIEDIVGVHTLSTEREVAPMRLTIEGRPQSSDIVVEAEKSMVVDELAGASNIFSQVSNNWSLMVNIILLGLFIFIGGVHFQIPVFLRLRNYLQRQGVDVIFDSSRHNGRNMEVPTTGDDAPVSVTEISKPEEKVADIIDKVVVDQTLATPARSRTESSATGTTSPKREAKTEDDSDQSSDAASGDEKGPDGDEETIENGTGPKRTTKRGKRGKRGGTKNKKKIQVDPTVMDEAKGLLPEVYQKNGSAKVGRLVVDLRDESCLGRGSNGTGVFPAVLEDRKVAVKRLVRQSGAQIAAKEIKHLLSSDENPHVVRYFGKEETPSFIYIALELFTASLDQFVEKPLQYPELIKHPEGFEAMDCLTQITEGVAHLHSLKLVHRDIKPQNVLVKPVKTSRPISGFPKLHFVISDFGLCKPLEDGPESAFAPTANHTAAGTTGWRAPELLVNYRDSVAAPTASSSASKSTHSADGTVIEPTSGRRATKAIDIFSLGCVFYYVMTQGRHPFDVGGTSLGRDLNIKENRFSTEDLRLHDYSYDADDLIMQMLKHDPRDRPDTAAILKHPAFWCEEDKLEFICDVSDCYEKEKNSIKNIHDEHAVRTEAELESLAELAALQQLGPNVIPHNDFLKMLPRSFVQEMGRQRKYTGNKMVDLLRVIRNKKNHFHDLPEDVKELMLGGSTKGYWRFWERRFPSLLVNCHCILIERGIVGRFRMERYY